MKRCIFVGSSREAIGICRAVQDELSDEFDVTIWDQGISGPRAHVSGSSWPRPRASCACQRCTSRGGVWIVRWRE
jgi:hypothetical protein